MSKREEYERKSEEIIKPILEEKGFDLWDIEYVKEGRDYYLRAYIDKEGGISIDDCVDVSRAFSDKLDEDEFIDEAYTLEVSSPGLGRTLKKDKEFQRSIGRSVDIKLYKALDKSKEFTGILKERSADETVIDADGRVMKFSNSDIASVKLSIDF